MPPKPTDGEAAGFQFLFAVLKHNKSTIEPAWDDVARECGISYGRNANTKFKDFLKKKGYRIDAGKILPIDETAPLVIAMPKKATQANGKKGKTPASNNKKRKITAQDDADGVGIEHDNLKTEEDAGNGDKDAGDDSEGLKWE